VIESRSRCVECRRRVALLLQPGSTTQLQRTSTLQAVETSYVNPKIGSGERCLGLDMGSEL
jgi:hypothetical protein